MEEKLKQLIDKRVHITFESKRHNGIFNLTGIILAVGKPWTYFSDWQSDYPEKFVLENMMMVNTSRIRSVEEVKDNA